MNSPYKRTTYNGKPIDEHRKVMEIYLEKFKKEIDNLYERVSNRKIGITNK